MSSQLVDRLPRSSVGVGQEQRLAYQQHVTEGITPMDDASWKTWKRNRFTTFAIGCVAAEACYLIGTLIVMFSGLGPELEFLFYLAAAVSAAVFLLCWIAATFERDHRWIVLPFVAIGVPASAFFVFVCIIRAIFH